ncbi:MAG: hypothetical protein SNG97_01595 [Rikenellaceae bacterium]
MKASDFTGKWEIVTTGHLHLDSNSGEWRDIPLLQHNSNWDKIDLNTMMSRYQHHTR